MGQPLQIIPILIFYNLWATARIAPTKNTQIIIKLGFQREPAPFGMGFGGQNLPI